MVRSRIRILLLILATPFLVVIGRLGALQLSSSEVDEEIQISSREQGRRHHIELLPPARGTIFDRHGNALSRDVATFDLEFVLGELHPRERILPTVEQSLELCNDRCLPVCRGQVLENHLVEILGGEENLARLLDGPPKDRRTNPRGSTEEGEALGASEEARAEETRTEETGAAREDPVLVDHIPLALKARLAQRRRPFKGLEGLGASTGLYFLASRGPDRSRPGRFELRAQESRLLSMELTLLRIARLCGRPYADLRKEVRAAEDQIDQARNATEREQIRRDRRFTLTTDIPPEALSAIVYQPELFPGIRVVDGHHRLYPYGECVAGLTGYVRPSGEAPRDEEHQKGLLFDDYFINLDFLDNDFVLLRRAGCRKGDVVIGQWGLEERYQERLKGSYGYSLVETDARQVPRRSLRYLPPERGEDLRTTIDIELQQTIYRALEPLCLPQGDALAGSAAVMDLTGRCAPDGEGPPGAILAASGYPGFKPQSMLEASYYAELKVLQEDLRQGILLKHNRPALSFESPGSVFKLVVAAAALQDGIEFGPDGSRRPSPLSLAAKFECTHQFRTPRNTIMHCLSTVGHGQPDRSVNLLQALQYSCNIYFYHLGYERLSPDLLRFWAEEFGFGRSTGIDLDAPLPPGAIERHAGLLRPLGRIQQRDMCAFAIGDESLVRASNLQVLRMVASIALGGSILPRPFLAAAAPPEKIALRPETTRILREGMVRVVQSPGGTAADLSLGLSPYQVALKTGTAELKDGELNAPDPRDRPVNSSWIAGFAPIEKPEIAFVILLERTQFHGTECARVLAPILEYFAQREPEKYRREGKTAGAAARRKGPPAAGSEAEEPAASPGEEGDR